MNNSTNASPILDRKMLMWSAIFLAIVVGSYWTVFVRLSRIWSINPDYSHGFLVLPFAGFLMYRNRKQWLPLLDSPKSWWVVGTGAFLIAFAIFMRAGGILGRALPVEGASLTVLLAGAMCLLGGPRMVYLNGAVLAFLLFMLPIPNQINRVLRSELQSYATLGSVFTLQTLGVPAINQGNVLKLPNSEVGVVEACSGLRILASLGAMAFAICVLKEQRWLNRILLLLSVVPIALFVNILRIVVTALGHEYLPAYADRIHDLAGWFMIGLAVLLLVGVQRYFDALFPFVPDSAEQSPNTSRRFWRRITRSLSR